jgi:hypothetical protein
MRDPEMCFELTKPIGSALIFDPYYWRNDYGGVEQFSRAIVRGHYVALSRCTNSTNASPPHGTEILTCKASRKPSLMLPFVASPLLVERIPANVSPLRVHPPEPFERSFHYGNHRHHGLERKEARTAFEARPIAAVEQSTQS